MKEPLIWFFLLGALLFAVDRQLNPVQETIIVDDAVRNHITNLWQTQMGREPSETELSSLVQNWLKDEVFYREALRLGLDRDDTIVRRRLVQKLGFLSQNVEDEALSDAALQAYYEEHIAEYTLPLRLTFSQVFFTDKRHTEKIRNQLSAKTDWRSLGDNSLLQGTYVSKSHRELNAILGEQFVTQLNQLEQGKWVGPLASSYGFHFVRLENIVPGEATPLSFIQGKVMADLEQARMARASQQYFENLVEQYSIEYR